MPQPNPHLVQEGQYIPLNTELICPIHQIISVIDLQKYLDYIIFTTTKTKLQNATCMECVQQSRLIRYSDSDTMLL